MAVLFYRKLRIRWGLSCIHPIKNRFIPETTPKTLYQLGLDEATWLEALTSQFKIKVSYRYWLRAVTKSLQR